MLRTGTRFSLIFQDAPHGSAVFAEETTIIRGCSARERNCIKKFRLLRTGARCLMKKLRNFEGAPHGSALSFQPDCVFAWSRCAVSGSQIVWALVEQDALHDFWNKVHCMSLEGVPEAQRVEHEHGQGSCVTRTSIALPGFTRNVVG